MALLCPPLCWGRATGYVHHKPHTAPLWGGVRARKALSTPLHVRCFHTLLFTLNSCT
jgi:hypothetical protein